MSGKVNDSMIAKFKDMLTEIAKGNKRFYEIDWFEDAWYKQKELKAEAKEVADAVTRLITETTGLMPEEQADAFFKAGYPFMKVDVFDKTELVGIFNRIAFEADRALKIRLLGGKDGELMGDREICDIIARSQCIHFQCETYPVEHDLESFTKFEVYVAYFLPGTHRGFVVRIDK